MAYGLFTALHTFGYHNRHSPCIQFVASFSPLQDNEEPVCSPGEQRALLLEDSLVFKLNGILQYILHWSQRELVKQILGSILHQACVLHIFVNDKNGVRDNLNLAHDHGHWQLHHGTLQIHDVEMGAKQVCCLNLSKAVKMP